MRVSSDYVIVDACSYCYGPASTMSAILDALAGRKPFDILFLGSGSAWEFLKDHPAIDGKVEINTESLADLEKAEELISASSLVFVNTNPVMAIFAKKLGVPVVYLDILPWMNSSIAEKIGSVAGLYDNMNKLRAIERPELLLAHADKFLMQAYLNEFPIDPLIQSPIVIAPLINRTVQRPVSAGSGKKNRLMISTGGLLNPDTGDETLLEYARLMADAGWEAARSAGLDEVWVCGPEKLKSHIPFRHGRTNLLVARLPHTTFLEELGMSRCAAIVPGLTSIYETFALGLPALLLPPTNYSQALQMKAVMQTGLAGRLVISEWDEIDRFSAAEDEIEGTKALVDGLRESVGKPSFRERLREGFIRLLSTEEQDELIFKRQAFVESLGRDGPAAVAGHVLEQYSNGKNRREEVSGW